LVALLAVLRLILVLHRLLARLALRRRASRETRAGERAEAELQGFASG
jgi:hypothetical protein